MLRFIKTLFISILLLISVLENALASECPTTSLISDSLPKNQAKNNDKGILKSKVKYNARDSIRFEIENQTVYLYGEAVVYYEDLTLNAGYMEINLNENTILAAGETNSKGEIINKPVFKQNEKVINADTIKYNTETKKGLIKELTTEENGGYVTTPIAKKDSNDIYFVKNGKYTTCEDFEHPHFHLALSKIKIIPDDKIVTGPGNLYIAGIPTPLGIPFGYFPNKKGRNSGLLIPAYGESPALGFFLTDGGYYLGLNDYMDLALRGTIYSKGSWGAKVMSNYKYRYRYSGNLFFGVNSINESEKDLPDFSRRQDYNFRWNHQQDPKLNPNSKFSANVNMLSSTFYKYNLNNSNNYLTNTFQSNIAWVRTWKYFNFSSNFRQNQNTITRKVETSLPQLTLSMNRLYPTRLLKKEGVIKTKWYDKIGVAYNSDIENRINVRDTNLFKPTVFDSMKYGIRHNIPVSASYNNRFFTTMPVITYSSLWYFDYINRQYSANDSAIFTDTLKGFKTANYYTASITFTTKLYGMYTPLFSRVKAIRHVLTPSISLNYRPDYRDKKYGYYQTIKPHNNTIKDSVTYSIFQNGIYGVPPTGKVAGLNFAFDNNLEVKVRNKKNDTINPTKKITLIESFGVSSFYNFALDSFNISPLNVWLRTKIFKNYITLTSSGIIDPYKLDSLRTTSELVWKEKKIGRLTYGLLAVNATFRSKPADKNKVKENKAKIPAYMQEYEYALMHSDYYVDFNIPWTFNFSYNLRYNKPYDSAMFFQSLNFDADVNLTEKWKIGVRSGFDFKAKYFTYTSVNIYRDLHCWEMSFSWIPIGFQKSYMVNINVKSAVLQDLKLSRKREWYDFQ